MTIKQRPQRLAAQVRQAQLGPAKGERTRAAVDIEARTVELAFASETPVDMWYGTEILSCAPGAMRQGTRQESLPLLFNHDCNDLLGVVEQIRLDGDRVARAVVRFGRDERGEWALQQCADGVLRNVSFMYRVYRWEEDTEAETLTALEWETFEISLVTMPADAEVGVGRSADAATENSVQLVPRAAAAPAPAQAAPGVLKAPEAQSVRSNLEDSEMKFRMHPVMNAVAEASTGGGGAAAGQAGAQAVDHAQAARDAAVNAQAAERLRTSEIEAICKKYGISNETRTAMIQRGATVEQARITAADLVIERAKSAGSAADFGDTHNPDLSTREKARYSMMRAINASLTSNWKDAGFELECSNEIGKRLGKGPQNERAFFMPTNIPFAPPVEGKRATYTVGTPGAGTTGGTLVATQLLAGSFIEVLRNKARVMRAGATVLSGLVGSVDIPRQTGASSTFWTTEGTNTTQSEATFDKVSLALKTIGTFSQVTRNMLMQATPDIDMIARADLIAQIALGIDLAALSGSGSSGQPLGVANQSGVNSVVGGTNGAQLTIDNVIDMETLALAGNAPEDTLAYLFNAKTVGWLKKAKSTTGQYLWTDATEGQRTGTPGEINGYTVYRTNQCRSTLTKGTANGICSELFFGAWAELLIGEWGVLEIVPNPYDAAVFKNGGVLLRVLQSVDVGVRHGASFSVMSDALTA